MARLNRIKTREGLEVVKRTGPDGRERIESFTVKAFEQLLDATLTELRVLAEEGRELLLDKQFATAARFPGSKVVARPPQLRRSRIPTSERRPFRQPPLADSTVKKKAALGQDGRRLIATGDYLYGIEVFKGTKQGKTYYTIRPKPGQHPGSGVTHRVLAAFHEFGTSKMPARPHWGPTLRILLSVMRQRRENLRANALRQAVRERR